MYLGVAFLESQYLYAKPFQEEEWRKNLDGHAMATKAFYRPTWSTTLQLPFPELRIETGGVGFWISRGAVVG